jgi:hypothetical protein
VAWLTIAELLCSRVERSICHEPFPRVDELREDQLYVRVPLSEAVIVQIYSYHSRMVRGVRFQLPSSGKVGLSTISPELSLMIMMLGSRFSTVSLTHWLYSSIFDAMIAISPRDMRVAGSIAPSRRLSMPASMPFTAYP